jgi:acyl-coenzyme A synthetase/AMP-(fatty) acid ligase
MPTVTAGRADEHLEIVPRLARTPSGKIKRFELRRRAAALRADAVAAT